MEKYEIIFFVIAILAYIICSMTLKIPIYAHLMLGTILSIILILAVLLKLQEKYGKKLIKSINIIEIIIFVFYIISVAYETWYQKTLIINSNIILIPFFGVLMMNIFLKIFKS